MDRGVFPSHSVVHVPRQQAPFAVVGLFVEKIIVIDIPIERDNVILGANIAQGEVDVEVFGQPSSQGFSALSAGLVQAFDHRLGRVLNAVKGVVLPLQSLAAVGVFIAFLLRVMVDWPEQITVCIWEKRRDLRFEKIPPLRQTSGR